MAGNFDGHAEEGELERYSMKSLPEAEAERLEEHLLVCEPCRQRLTETDRYVSAMRRASAQVSQKPRQSFSLAAASWPVWLAAAAAVVMALIAIQKLRPWDAAVPPVAVDLSVMRGPVAVALAPAGKPLELRLDVAGLPAAPAWRIELVNAEGADVWRGPASRTDTAAVVGVPSQSPGTYFVRLYSGEGAMVREYGLELRALPPQ